MPLQARFTIVIPTRNRADVLSAALATAVSQSDSNVEILVSDNASEDNTSQVVASFSDSRIRYITPGRVLGMAEHWEFALAHVPAGYVTILGDDDGLLPDAVERARHALAVLNVKAIAWRKAEYHWPDHIVPWFRNSLQIPFGDVSVLESTAVLADVLGFNRTYTDLPCVYNSFIATEIFETLRQRSSGRILPCITPDLYSGIAAACVVDRYAFSGLPLSVNAASRHSNGTISTFRGVNAPEALPHFSCSAEQIHPRLVKSSSVPVLIADAALIARERLGRRDGWPELNWHAMLKAAASDAEHRPPAVFEETLGTLDEIARRNDLVNVWSSMRGMLAQKELPTLQPPGWDSQGRQLSVDGEKLGLRTVEDATWLTAAVIYSVAARDREYDGKRTPGIATLPGQIDGARREAWTKFLSQLQRPTPPPAPTRLLRYWRGVRRRLRLRAPIA